MAPWKSSAALGTARRGRAVAALCVLLLAAAVTALAGVRVAGALALVWAVFSLPGFCLLGRPRSLQGLALGMVTGLAVSSLALFAVGLGGAELTARVGLAVPLALALATFAARHSLAPAPLKPHVVKGEVLEETGHDRAAIAAAVVGLACLVLPALFGVGRLVDGAHRYVPFFCADLFKQAAYVGALASGSLPPGDPFSGGAPLNYYWLAFVAPATALELAGSAVRAIDVLRVQVLFTGITFVVLLFAVCRRAGASALAALGAVLLGVLSPTLDGIAALLLSPWLSYRTLVQQVNQEALDLTDFFGAPSHFAASTLYRLSLYVPQHQLAIALCLGWFLLAEEPRDRARTVASVLLIVALPLTSLLVAPSALFAMALARLFMLARASVELRRSSRIGALVELGAVLVAGGALLAGRVVAPAVDIAAVRGLAVSGVDAALRWAYFPVQLVTSFGGVGGLGVLGAVLAFRASSSNLARSVAAALLLSGLAGLVSGEALPRKTELSVNLELKASFIAATGAVIGCAVALDRLRALGAGARRLALVSALLVALGLPGAVHDQLFHGTFLFDPLARQRFHVAVPAADLAALDWARRATPRHARFLQLPRPSFLWGGPDTWVPIFGGRAVPAAPRASQRDELALRRAELVFSTESAAEARKTLRELGADYVYLSAALDPRRYGELVARFASAPADFRRVYAGEGVSIWQVLPGAL
jgi:hypothetical protein